MEIGSRHAVQNDVRLLLPPSLASILLSDCVAIFHASATRQFGEFSISRLNIGGNFSARMDSPITARQRTVRPS